MTFTVLSVCTGNICRSPMCERLIAARTRDAAVGITSDSAGTHGLTGYPMDAPSAAVLRALGGDPDGHVARRLGAVDVEAADLVLTATAEQRDLVTRLLPAARDRAFTMREFARLATDLPTIMNPGEDALREQVRAVAARRSPGRGSPDDIGDPFGAGDDEVRRVGQQVSDAVDGILAGLGLARPC